MMQFKEVVNIWLREKMLDFRYSLDLSTKPSFSDQHKIYFLGKQYSPDKRSRMQDNFLRSFINDFNDKIWFSYRRNFPPILSSPKLNENSQTKLLVKEFNSKSISNSPASKNISNGIFQGSSAVSSNSSRYVTDMGWGCMVRSAQMLMAQTIEAYLLDKNKQLDDPSTDEYILRLFADSDSSKSPFSLHNIIRVSQKQAGEWFGSFSIIDPLVRILYEAKETYKQLNDLEIYVARDRAICFKEAKALFGQKPHKANKYKCSQNFSTFHTGKSSYHSNYKSHDPLSLNSESPMRDKQKSLLILIPFMFGIGKLVDPLQLPSIFEMMRIPFFIGLLGGEPRRSYYICGFQNDKFICFDPHFIQDFVDQNQKNFPKESYYGKTPKLLSSHKLDPSVTFGFLFRNKKQFEEFSHLILASKCLNKFIHICCSPEKRDENCTIGNLLFRGLKKNNRTADELNDDDWEIIDYEIG